MDPPRTVLVKDEGQPAGIWTGRLYRWERYAAGWFGWARWQTERQLEEGLVPAARLRPFDERPVRVYMGGEFGLPGRWCDGRLLGWRRRPGYPWEARVGIWGDRIYGGVDWYSIDRLSEPDPAVGMDAAY